MRRAEDPAQPVLLQALSMFVPMARLTSRSPFSSMFVPMARLRRENTESLGAPCQKV